MPTKSKKTNEKTSAPAVAEHGAAVLPAVTVDSYNVEVKDGEGFIGDRTTNGAFRDIIDDWRRRLKKWTKTHLAKSPVSISVRKSSISFCSLTIRKFPV